MPRLPREDVDLIAAAPMSDSLRALARLGTARPVRKGMQLISEGDVGDTLYIVLAGTLRAYAVGADGRNEVTYGEYGAGEYVGEMSLDGGPRAAHVEATAAGVCVVVTRATLERHLAADPHFAFELLAKVIRRARAATMGLKQIALNDVYGRLKILLESLAVAQAAGGWLIDPAPTHLQMAHRLACGREMVSRVMKDLERGGYVEVGRRRVVICRVLPAKW